MIERIFTVKKRIFTLLLAALMIAAIFPTAAFAKAAEPVTPCVEICPICHEGHMRIRRTMNAIISEHRAVCPHDPVGRYNCIKQEVQYLCEKKCSACGFGGGTYYEYGYVWKHDACPCCHH